MIVPVASIAQRPTPSRQPFPPSVKEIVPSDAEIGNEEVAVDIRCHRTRETGHLHAVDVEEARRDYASDRSVAGHDFDARIRLIEALP